MIAIAAALATLMAAASTSALAAAHPPKPTPPPRILNFVRQKDRLMEYVCNDNEKDRANLVPTPREP